MIGMESIDMVVDDTGRFYVVISELEFMDRQNIHWDMVEKYVRKYIGNRYSIHESSDVIYVGGDFPSEVKGSEDTKRLRGTNAKAKANAMVILEKLIYVAENKRWQENYKPKHSIDAKGGWYRYTTRFAFPIKDSIGKVDRYNLYRIEILVRCTSDGELYLYDLVNVKKEGESQKNKEADTPLEQNAVR